MTEADAWILLWMLIMLGFGPVAFALDFFSLWHRPLLEERWMRAQLCPAYNDYARRTAALVPGIL